MTGTWIFLAFFLGYPLISGVVYQASLHKTKDINLATAVASFWPAFVLLLLLVFPARMSAYVTRRLLGRK